MKQIMSTLVFIVTLLSDHSLSAQISSIVIKTQDITEDMAPDDWGIGIFARHDCAVETDEKSFDDSLFFITKREISIYQERMNEQADRLDQYSEQVLNTFLSELAALNAIRLEAIGANFVLLW